MVKSKVGAEPKKRIRHIFCQQEGIHEGIHRDEPGWFESNYHPYCFGYGYFFHRGKGLAEKLTPDYIKDNWDNESWCRGIKTSCMAIIDSKRKIAVIKVGTEYSIAIKRSVPENYTIYKVDEDIPVYNITESKNKKILINMYVKYLIKKYLETFYNEYKVLNTISKQIPEHTYISSARAKYLKDIKDLVEKYNRLIPKCKPLCNNVIYISGYNVGFPSINAILNDNLFDDKQKLHIKKCKFYTKYCLHKDISWKELNKNWSDEYVAEIEAKDKADYEAFIKRAEKFKAIAKNNYEEVLAKQDNNINDWRNGNKVRNVKYTDYYIDETNRHIASISRELDDIFANTQLRLRPGKPNWVETSRGAVVPLETAIDVFNRLYTNYILSGKTEFTFSYNQFRIGSFCVSRCMYINKFADNLNVGKLGKEEWVFNIGCHRLWFDDIKDFARYYNLQNKLSFPLDKTTAECMENHLIHLSSGKTIKTVGTINV
jgi:hypothetical protein|nr:MAG TPA: hypothetical protein [Crassvirales sp.]